MTEKIIILDFGSQVTQLIGRRLRELNVYCEIHPFNKIPALDESVRGVVLSGSPWSVRDPKAPSPDLSGIKGRYPMLCICYGAQFIAQRYGGEVNPSIAREYGRAIMHIKGSCPLFEGIPDDSQVWMSHGDTIARLPEGAEVIASTDDVANAAYHIKGEQTWCVQFHPEVYHSTYGPRILENFAMRICGCRGDWTPASFIESSIGSLRETIGKDNVILGLSGGVDSTVAAVLLNKAIGQQLHCIFVNNGLLRKNEYESVLASYQDMGLNVRGVDATELFLKALEGISDPEAKRKAIGRTFIEVFDAEAHKIENASWLAQGTIYPDVIESTSVNGPSQTIKSHHNVGGLPDCVDFKEIIEPLRDLFKDEVRKAGLELGLPEKLVFRQPFPGPGLGIRIIGEVTAEKVRIVQDADAIYREEIANAGLDRSIGQYFAALTNMRSVGVMGDERTYDYAVALRAVNTVDFMTAEAAKIPYEVLDKVMSRIINEVRGVNRVFYDLTSKPPGTIEFE